jgi:hypothetical protein
MQTKGHFIITTFFILTILLSACGAKTPDGAITPGGPTSTASASETSAPTEPPTPSPLLTVSKTGFTQIDRVVWYAFIIKNVSPDMAAENISYKVIVSDQNGSALATDKASIGLLMPNQELGFVGSVKLKKDQVMVKLDISQTGADFTKTESLPTITIDPATVYSDETGNFAVSLVTNPFNHKLVNLKIYAVAYNANGDIIGGAVNTMAVLLAKSSGGVRLMLNRTADVARVDLYAELSDLAAANPDYENPPSSDLVVQDYGFGQMQDRASFGILFKNPSSTEFLQGSRFHMTAYSADGKVVAAANGSLPVLLPGETFGMGGRFRVVPGTSIDHLDFQVLTGDYLTGDPQLKFQFEGVAFVPGAPGKVIGTLVNPYANLKFKNLAVYALARDASGKIVGGGMTNVNPVEAASKVPVEVVMLTSAAVTSVEMFTFVPALDDLK